MFISIKSIFPRILSRVDSKNKLYSFNVINVFQETLKEYYSDDLLDFVEPQKYQNSNLFLRCKNSGVASEIQLRRTEILNKINKRLGCLKRERVDNLIFI